MKQLIVLFLFFGQLVFAQSLPVLECDNAEFTQVVKSYLDLSVPAVTPLQIKDSIANYLVLDIREKAEYKVSHLPEAVHFGYDKPNWDLLKDIDKDQEIIVYCSIGYRSEKIGEQLLKRGYTQVTNIYGSIFEWANQGLPLCDEKSQPTKKIHGYNKDWSQWIKNKDYQVKY